MTKTIALIAVAIALAASPAIAGKGVKCGNSYIAAGKTCHIDAKKPPVCKKGKLCGDTCIAKDKVCTK